MEWLGRQLDQIDAISLSLIAYIGRGWGIDDLAGPAAAAAEVRLDTPSLADDEVALRRLVQSDSPPPSIPPEELPPTTRVLAAALHCDQGRWNSLWEGQLADLIAEGGYGATHAGLAVGWMSELGCATRDPGLRGRVIDSIATELARTDAVTDLAVEQSALLYYLGAGDRVPAGWSRRVVESQRDDGGWGAGQSNWHMTLLAVWTLLAAERPAEDAAMTRGST